MRELSQEEWHYLDCALAQVCAAKVLAMRNEEEATAFLGPSLLLLGFGVEAFIKAVLLCYGKSQTELSSQPFRHNLWYMWQLAELEKQRPQAELYAEQCCQELQLDYAPPQDRDRTDPRYLPGVRRERPSAEHFGPHLEQLSELHSGRSNYALRYPTEPKTVPDPMLLICVFDRLTRGFMNGQSIARVE